MKKLKYVAATAFLVFTGCRSSPVRQVVLIDRAATLTRPFDQLAGSVPQLDLHQRSGGSRFLLQSDVDLNQPVDVLALADVQLFEKPASPAQTRRFPWWSIFAGNEIGIAYTAKSKSAAQITETNWPQVLQQDGVQTGYADPELDPEGYNTILAWTLAESYYYQPGLAAKLRAFIPQRNIRGDSTQLIAMLNAGELDYAWEYRSVAMQHHLAFLQLPKQVNLSDPSLAAVYHSACMELHHGGGVQQQCGQPILYAVAIAADSPHPQAAAQFVEALYGDAGRAALTSAFQQPLSPAAGGDLKTAPAWLQALQK